MQRKVAIFLPSLEGGGAERMMLNLAKGMKEREMDVDLIVAKMHGPYKDSVPEGVNLIDLECTRMLKSIKGLINYLNTMSPHVLLTTLESASIIGILAKIFSKNDTNVWVRVPNHLSLHAKNAKRRRDKLRPFFARNLYKYADGIISISEGVAKDISSITKIMDSKLNVIYNPVVSAQLVEESKEIKEHKWLDCNDNPVILAVGRLTKQKNFELLIKSFKEVREKVDARLIILGEGEERKQLEALISKLNLVDFVDLPGFDNNPYVYMKKADVFVLSSSWEGFGNVLVESMALGTPVVSTDCPSGPREILNNGEYGFLVDLSDPKGLSNKIITIIEENPFSEEEMIKRANEFSIKKVTDQYINLLMNNGDMNQ